MRSKKPRPNPTPHPHVNHHATGPERFDSNLRIPAAAHNSDQLTIRYLIEFQPKLETPTSSLKPFTCEYARSGLYFVKLCCMAKFATSSARTTIKSISKPAPIFQNLVMTQGLRRKAFRPTVPRQCQKNRQLGFDFIVAQGPRLKFCYTQV
jgi:hypothetical protein